VQASTTSQIPADARQVVPALTKASAGQTAAEPVQVSRTSQTPADARQVVAALAKL